MLQREHALGLRKARIAADRIARALESEFDCECTWDGNTLRFRRAGADGEMTVGRRAIDLRIELGFLLSAFKPRIEQSISDSFDRYFG